MLLLVEDMNFSTGNERLSAVLVTGGNGCLGRFIVDFLLELLPDLKILRILDNDPSGKDYFSSKYASSDVNIHYIHEDLRNSSAIRRAVVGIQCVFHTASVVDVSMFPDDNLMWAVNCKGTQDLLDACYENSVEYFIYTSSVNSIVGFDSNRLVDAVEDDCVKPHTWLWGGYGETKCLAERMVLDSNKIVLPNGSVSKNVCLRPTVFYGENDRANIPNYLKMAANQGGNLLQIGSRDCVLQQTYVGNVAWAHLCALQALYNHPGKTAGNSYFITDNTPLINPFKFTEPFLQDQHWRLISTGIPLWIAYYFMIFLVGFVKLFRKVFPTSRALSRLYSMSSAQIRFLMAKPSFSRKKAEERLGYQPRFSFEESLERSRKYYNHN